MVRRRYPIKISYAFPTSHSLVVCPLNVLFEDLVDHDVLRLRVVVLIPGRAMCWSIAILSVDLTSLGALLAAAKLVIVEAEIEVVPLGCPLA